MSWPLVSIITPAYRAASFIEETIASVRAQTVDDFEHLIVDDRSPDDTAAVVQAWAYRDPRIVCIRHDTNGGPARARNTALARAQGQYIAFLDSDDLWVPEKLERQLAFMRETGTALSFSSYRRFDHRTRTFSGSVPAPRRITYSDLLKNTAIMTSSVVIDRRQTGPFEMPVTHYDDYVAWLGILRRGFVAEGLDEDLVHYRVVPGSFSRNKLKSAAHVWNTYRHDLGISAPKAAWYFAHYAANALRKYTR